MSYLKLTIPAVVLLAGFFVCTTVTYGTAAYAKQEKKACSFCHTVAVPKDADSAKSLTDAGKYFQEHKSLDGYKKQ
jgi:pyrrolidone-carboxylate peptidase